MGHIKEPEGVDFVINSRPLTKEEEIAISKFIRAYKAKYSQRPAKRKRTERIAASLPAGPQDSVSKAGKRVSA